MTDSTQAARSDLAFLRGVAEDRGPLPAAIGQNFLTIGLLYGLNVIAVWAGRSGLVPWPDNDVLWGWLPATLLYAPYSIYFSLRFRGAWSGPTLRAFTFAWLAVILMTVTIVAVIFTARAQTGVAYELLWPPIAMALYGGSWTIIGLVRRDAGDLLIAAGCFATAVTCAFLIGGPAMFLALGLGILLFLGGPGVRIMLKARAQG
jgi:hypothetical protein